MFNIQCSISNEIPIIGETSKFRSPYDPFDLYDWYDYPHYFPFSKHPLL